MGRKPSKKNADVAIAADVAERSDQERRLCTLPETTDRPLPEGLDPLRLQLIRQNEKKWVNGTVLRYYFFDRPTDGAGGRWVGPDHQRNVVRKAFKAWKDIGIGLVFHEVSNREDAEVRIGFEKDAGSWSYVGRDVIDAVRDPNLRTMNFGWDLRTAYGWDTALHEIGHTLGFPHEHQNPRAGIIWNEQAVYRYFRGRPNFWSDGTIRRNILDKLSLASTSGSEWDPNSIMHYSFEPGLIQEPASYRAGLVPEPGLSAHDIGQVQKFYPPVAHEIELAPFESRHVQLEPAEQVDFRIRPPMTRKYTMQTFGSSDCVMVLFEQTEDGPRYISGEDDAGTASNARIEAKLFRERQYILRVRVLFAEAVGQTAILLW